MFNDSNLVYFLVVEMCFIVPIYLAILASVYIASGITYMNLARIAGRKDIAWMAWVPICNIILQLLLIKKSGWWTLMALVPVANIVFGIIWEVKKLKAFDKHWAFCLLLFFFPQGYLTLWMIWSLSKETQYTLNTAPEPTAA